MIFLPNVLQYFKLDFKCHETTLGYYFKYYLGLTTWGDVEDHLHLTPSQLYVQVDSDFYQDNTMLLTDLYIILSWMVVNRSMKLKEWDTMEYRSFRKKIIWTTINKIQSVIPENQGGDKAPSTSTPSTQSSTSTSQVNSGSIGSSLKKPPAYSQVSPVVQQEVQVEPSGFSTRVSSTEYIATPPRPIIATGKKLFPSPNTHWKDGWDESAQEDPSITSLRSRISKAEKDFLNAQSPPPDPPGSVTSELDKKPLKPEKILTPPPEVETSAKDEVSVLSGGSHGSAKQKSHKSKASLKSQGSRKSRNSKSNHDKGPPSSSMSSSDTPYRKKLIIRSKLNDKVYWNGMRSSFSKFEKLVDGHLLQVGLNYLLDTHFQTMYMEKGTAYYTSKEFQSKYDTTEEQATWDRQYMYGILKATTRGFEDNTTNAYKQSRDGFSAWIILKRTYAHGGSMDHKTEDVEASIAVKFNPKKQKMVDYLDEFERLATQLSTLNPNEWPRGRKIKLLRKNISPAGPDIRHMLRKIKDLASDWDFTKCVTYLRDEAFDYDKEHPVPSKSTSTNLMHTDEPVEDIEEDQGRNTLQVETDAKAPLATYACINNLVTELGVVSAYKVLTSQSMRESLHIPGDIWFKLEPTMRQQIDEDQAGHSSRA